MEKNLILMFLSGLLTFYSPIPSQARISEDCKRCIDFYWKCSLEAVSDFIPEPKLNREQCNTLLLQCSKEYQCSSKGGK